MSESTRLISLKTFALWAAIVAALAAAATAFNWFRARQAHTADVAAYLKAIIQTEWQKDPV